MKEKGCKNGDDNRIGKMNQRCHTCGNMMIRGCEKKGSESHTGCSGQKHEKDIFFTDTYFQALFFQSRCQCITDKADKISPEYDDAGWDSIILQLSHGSGQQTEEDGGRNNR